jgi:hypothetical protein
MAVSLVRRLFRGAVGAVAVSAISAGIGAQQRNIEYEVKAAFLYNFLTFVHWPESAFAGPGAPFRLCIVGQDPFGSALEALVNGESVGTHRTSLERLTEDQSASACHVAFVSKNDDDRLETIVRVTEKRSVLVVGETPRLNQLCGGIAFAVEGDRVRFDINLPALTGRGLRVSSKLLRVARDASDRLGGCRR